MLDWLQINQFAIADHIEIEFDDRFTTVTGETGSGKSLLINALELLLGGRADHSYIRHDRDKAEIQAGFDLPKDHSALAWLQRQELEHNGECIVRRVVRRDKASRGYINGHGVTAAQMRELGSELVDIHGQNEHHSLLKRAIQRQLLDTAAGNTAALETLGDHYQSLRDVEKQIATLNSESYNTRERADLLEFQIEELKALSPKSDEWEHLEVQHKKLNHQQELSNGAREVAGKLLEADSESLHDELLSCATTLEQLSRFDESLKTIVDMLNEARINLEEAADQLRGYYEGQNLDASEIQRIEERFSAWHSLSRKHRIQPGLLSGHLEQMQQELAGLNDPEKELERLQSLFDNEVAQYRKVAGKISKNRKQSAARLSKEVTVLMQELGMNGGRFEISLNPVEAGQFTRYGCEGVEFQVSANPGQPVQPLGKVASGGELSRISLAIQVILANRAQVPTLVFDEVDVGIGGKVANVVGEKLKQLGRSSQVICITHLSQVAARGDQQLNVSKQGDSPVNASVTRLDPQQRIEEIARMSAGDPPSEQSLAHARELLKEPVNSL